MSRAPAAQPADFEEKLKYQLFLCKQHKHEERSGQGQSTVFFLLTDVLEIKLFLSFTQKSDWQFGSR